MSEQILTDIKTKLTGQAPQLLAAIDLVSDNQVRTVARDLVLEKVRAALEDFTVEELIFIVKDDQGAFKKVNEEVIAEEQQQ